MPLSHHALCLYAAAAVCTSASARSSLHTSSGNRLEEQHACTDLQQPCYRLVVGAALPAHVLGQEGGVGLVQALWEGLQLLQGEALLGGQALKQPAEDSAQRNATQVRSNWYSTAQHTCLYASSGRCAASAVRCFYLLLSFAFAVHRAWAHWH